MVLVQAKDFVHPHGFIVESATLLADALVKQLNDGQDLDVSLSGVKGIPSSYFNVVLQRVVEQFGPSVVGRRLTFQFDTQAQRQVYQRSLDAVLKAHA